MQFIAILVLTQMSAYRAFSGSKEQQNISAVALFIAQWPDINLIRHATPVASYQSNLLQPFGQLVVFGCYAIAASRMVFELESLNSLAGNSEKDVEMFAVFDFSLHC
jgi:hypothetical protein